MKSRIVIVSAVLLYFCCFYAARNYLDKSYAYWGFSVAASTPLEWTYIVLTVIASALFLPRRVSKPSEIILYALLCILVVPFCALALNAGSEKRTTFLGLAGALGVAFILTSAFSRVKFWRGIHLPSIEIHRPILLFAALTAAWFTTKYYSVMRFASFDDVYELRNSEHNRNMTGFENWLVLVSLNVTLPFLTAYGVTQRRMWGVALGIYGFLVFYLISGAKYALLMPALIVLVYMLYKRDWVRRWMSAIILLTAASLTVVSLAFTNATNYLVWVPTLWIFRTTGVPALTLWQYYDFFSGNGYTYWTHLRIFRAFSGNAYDKQLGFVMGEAWYNAGNLQLNANFYATDGLAAAGIPGLFIIAAIAGLYFSFLNACAKQWDRTFVVLWFVPYCISLTNMSLFTMIWSGGGLILAACLLFGRQSTGPYASLKTPAAPPAAKRRVTTPSDTPSLLKSQQ